MSLTANLALSQVKINRNRSIMTLLGIVLSAAMLTAVCGFVSSAKQTVYRALGMEANAPLHAALIAMGALSPPSGLDPGGVVTFTLTVAFVTLPCSSSRV